MSHARRSPAKSSSVQLRSALNRARPAPLALEQRLIFDGDVAKGTEHAAAAVEVVIRSADTTISERATDLITKTAAAAAEPAGGAAPPEIVFVDTAVADWQALVANAKPGAEVYLLDPARDGLVQVQEVLAGRTEIGAIHLVSHGSEGTLLLGSGAYTAENLAEHQTVLAAIGRTLANDGDILLYGCDIGRGYAGTALVGRIASETQADVAASADLTGAAAVGGNWTLEMTEGEVTRGIFLTDRGVAAYGNWLSSVSLNGRAGWTPVMFGANQDPVGDSQAGAADTDIVGDATHGSLYTAYDDAGTSNTADDTIAFRLRLDNPTGPTTFNGVAIVGIDANLDGRIDIFISVDGRNNTQAVRLLDPGTSANISPNTTSTSPLPTGWLPNNGVYPFTAGNYSVVAVSEATDPHWNGDADLGDNGKTDVFVNWRIPVADLAAVLAKASPVDRNGVYGPRGAAGLPGFTKNTVVRYVSFTQTQPGPINGDLNGVGSSYNKEATFASLGAFTAPMTPSEPVAAGPRVAISTPAGDGVLNAAEDDAVSISGTSQFLANRTLTLVASDGDATVTGTTTIASDGSWTVSGLNLSHLNDGTLTFTATVDPDSDPGTNNSVSDATTLLHDKTAPMLVINPLLTTTAGTPTFTGTSDLPDGSIITLILDPDNDPGTANLVYQIVVTGGAWSLNTAAVSPVSGVFPAGGLTANTKVTASASDAAGNVTTALALNPPTINRLSTNSTTPTLTGTWTRVPGDVLTVTIQGATYTLAPGGNTWTLNLATATPTSGSLAPLVAGQSYDVIATVTRAGVSVSDFTAAEVTIVNTPVIAIGIDGGAAVGGTDTTPLITGTSQNAGGFVIVRLDPGNDGNLADAVTYSVVPLENGTWTLDTGTATPISGSVPAAGFIGATGVRASNSTGVVEAVQTITVTTPSVTIGSVLSSATTNAFGVVNNTGPAANYLNVTEDDAVRISGTATDGFTVNVVISDANGNSVTASNVGVTGGAWTTDALNLSNLDNSTLTIRATLAGTSISVTDTSVTHDKVPPAIINTTQSVIRTQSGTNGTPIKGLSDLAAGTSLTVSVFTAADYSGTPQTFTATVQQDGTWSAYSPNSFSPNATYYIRVAPTATTTDGAGNVAQKIEFSRTTNNSIGNTDRLIVVRPVTGDNVVTGDEIAAGVAITGETNQLNSTVTVEFRQSGVLLYTKTTTSGGSYAAGTGNWSVTLTANEVRAMANGVFQVTARVTDSSKSVEVYGGEYATLDLTTPVLSITDNIAGIAAGPVTFTFTFSEPVTGFDASDITLVNGTKGAFTVVNSTTYTLVATPTPNASGNMTASVSASAATGANTGRPNTAASDVQPFNTTAAAAAPSITVDSSALATDPTPLLTGTTSLAAGAPIVITIDADNDGSVDLTYSTTVQTGGTWSLDLDTAVPTAGTLPAAGLTPAARITATATNAYGISSAATALNKPTVTAQSTNDSTPTIAGTWTQLEGDTLAVVVNGVTYSVANGNLAVTATGWSLTPTTALPDATYSVTATVTRASGGSAVDPSSGELLVDTLAVVTISGGANAALTGDPTPIISGTSSGLPAGSVLTLSLDTNNDGHADVSYKTVIAADGTWVVDTASAIPASGVFPPGGLNGPVPLVATATDPSGNTGTDTQTLTVDVTGPVIAITSNSKTPDTTPVITGTTDLPAGSTITIEIDPDNDGDWSDKHSYTATVGVGGTWSVEADTPLSGTVNVRASAADSVGNTTSTTRTITIGPAPTLAIASPELGQDGIANAAEDDGVEIRGISTGTSAGDLITISITDGTRTIVDTAVVQSDLSWSIAALDLSGFSDGTISVNAVLTDSSGNAYGDSLTFQHDQTLPVPMLSAAASSITGATTVTVTFVEDVTGLAVQDFAASNGALISNLSGTGRVYTFTLTPAVNGSAAVWLPAAAVADLAGNESAGSNLLTFTVSGLPGNDTIAPTITSIVRQAPAAALTNADMVTFRITFSEAVQHVDAGDFALTGTAAAGASISGVSQVSPFVYDVAVGGPGLAEANGTLSLALSSAHDISDVATQPNALVNPTPTGAHESYTLDNVGPILVASDPADNAVQVAAGSNLTLTFDTSVVAGTGAIVLMRTSDSVVVESFDVATGFGSAGGRVVFAGTTITLDPAVALADGTAYHLHIASTAVKDVTGNSYAGLNDPTALNFTTAGAGDQLAPSVNAGQLFTYNENQSAGAVIGTVIATDNSGVTGFRFSETATDTSPDGRFTLAADGTIRMVATDGAQNDFETLPNTFVYGVQAGDGAGNWSAAVNVTLQVANVNDHAPVIGNQTVTLAENSAAGTPVATAAATDADGDPITYSIAAGNESGAFAIDPTTGEITVADAAKLDFETAPVFTLTIAAADGQHVTTGTVTVSLSNIDEGLPAIGEGQVFSYPENRAAGAVVGTVVATDDIGVTGFRFSATGTDTSGDGCFVIRADGKIELTALGAALGAPTNDFETGENLFTHGVQAGDAAGNWSAAVNVTLQLTDVNETVPDTAAPQLEAGQEFSYAENQSANALVATVAASDNIAVTGFRFSASQAATSADGFYVIDAAGNVRITAAGVAAGVAQNDFEMAPNRFTLGVEACDAAGNWSAAVDVVLHVTNLNDHAPVLGDYTTSLPENSPGGMLVRTVTATDADGDPITYSIVGGNEHGAFAINPTTGAITVADPTGLDFETTPVFALVVEASDGKHTATGTVTINLSDIDETVRDEAPPAITGPTGGAGAPASTKTVAENTTAVATFLADEPATWSIVGGDDADLFVMDPQTGQLAFKTAPDFEAPADLGDAPGNNTYVVIVEAKDAAGNVSTQSVIVTVADVDESVLDTNPPVIAGPANVTVRENTTAVAGFSADETVTWSIAGGADAARFTIDPSTGALRFLTAPDYERPGDVGADNVYAVVIEARDAANNRSSRAISVTVENVNEAPVASSVGSRSVQIGAALTPIVVPAFTDVDSANLTYAATRANGGSLPAWLSFDPGNRLFSGTPPAGTEPGDIVVRVTGSDGSLTASTTFVLTVSAPPRPVATPDSGRAVEDAATPNSVGSTVGGNVLGNDTGAGIAVSSAGGVALPRSGSITVAGSYGTLSIAADGSYSYALDNTLRAVDALNVGDTLTDSFGYTITDVAGQRSSATLTITIHGSDDPPIASTATGGTAVVGAPLEGIVVPAFQDVDNTDIRYSARLAGGGPLPAWLSFDPTTRTLSGTPPFGTLPGTLEIRISGTAGGATASTVLVVTVANPPAPVAVADQATATEAGGIANSIAGAPATGNVLANDRGTGSLGVVQVQSDTGSAPAGNALAGRYGVLTLNADGGYHYVVDERNAAVEALNAGDSLTDRFDYQITDRAGQTATATLTIVINGTTDAAVPVVLPEAPVMTTPAPVQPATPSGPAAPVMPAPSPGLSTPVIGGESVSGAAAPLGAVSGDPAMDPTGRAFAAAPLSGSDSGRGVAQGFAVTIIPAEAPSLVVYRGVPDQFYSAAREITFTIPPDAFAHTRAESQIVLSAALIDGRPLPDWLVFDRVSGTFQGQPPADFTGELRIKVIARDAQGLQAEAIFRVNVGAPTSGPQAKLGVSQQLRSLGYFERHLAKPAALARRS